MSLDRVQSYLKTGFEKVPGWCSPRFLEIAGLLAEEMRMEGVVGGACEIGVSQGKFFIGLTHAVEGRSSLAIDLFDNQDENIDGSGAGQPDMLAGFLESVRQYGCNSVEHMQRNSFDLDVRDIIKIIDNFGKFQIFSIDGGHTAESVVNDYTFAESVTHHGGIIIVNDITNTGWPGVMDGIARLFIGGKPKFVPVLIGHNKLILAGLSFHARYLKALREKLPVHLPDLNFRVAPLFGHNLIALV